MKKKKGSLFFMPLVVIISFIVLIYLYYVLLSKNGNFIKSPIGSRQFDLLKAYAKADGALLYIDQSAKYSLQQAIYDLAQNGGSVSEFDAYLSDSEQIFYSNDCGKKNGAFVWLEIKKDSEGKLTENQCIDENSIEENYIFYFDNKLNSHLKNHQGLPANNYKYHFKDNLEITGMALSPIKFLILKDEAKAAEKKPVDVAVAGIPQNLKDFTGTELCAPGFKCLLTEEAYSKLIAAENLAEQKGIKLLATEGYRDIDEIKRLWQANAKKYPDTAERERKVCNPDNAEKCPHLSGNAIDIFIKGKNKRTMNSVEWVNLYGIMKANGWVRYWDDKLPDVGEKWHFECCGTDRYARAQAAGVAEII